MKNRYFHILPIIALAVLIPQLAFAQMSDGNREQIERLRMELEMTDQIIQHAHEAVRATNSPAAALALEQAVALQRQAKDNFHGERYLIAAKLTGAAREQARKALAASRFSEQGEEVVLRRLERTKDLLHRAHEAMSNVPNQNLQAIFDAARRNLAQAFEFYRKLQYRPAIKLANQAEQAAHRIMQMVGRRDNSEVHFKRRLETTQAFLERVRDLVTNCGSTAGKEMFERAEEAFRNAADLSAQGLWEAALRRLQNVRRMGLSAAEHCGMMDDIGLRLERLVSEAGRIRELIDPDDEIAHRLLHQTYEQLDSARRFLENQNGEAAAAALKTAQLTLRQLKQILSGE